MAALLSAVGEDENEQHLLERALSQILDLLPCDLAEINRFDPGLGYFIPLRWANDRSRPYLRDHASDRYQLGEGYTGWLAEQRSPLLIGDTHAHPEPLPKTGLDSFPFRSYLGVPIVWGGELLGTLELAHHAVETYTPKSLGILQLFASQLSLCLHLRRLEERVDQGALQQRLSSALHQAASDLGDLQAVWEGMSRSFLEHVGLSLLGIFLQEQDNARLSTPFLFEVVSQGWHARAATLEAPPQSDLAAIWHHQEYWVANQPDEAKIDVLGLAAVMEPERLGKILIVPLRIGTQQPGLMLLGRSGELPEFREEEINVLLALSKTVSVVLHSSQQLQQVSTTPPPEVVRTPAHELKQAQATISPERMAELLRLSAELTASLDIDRSLGRVLKLCNELLLADRAIFITCDRGAEAFITRQVIPDFDTMNQEAVTLNSLSHAIAGWVNQRKQALLLDDLLKDGRWPSDHYRSLCAVPCLSGIETTGVLLFFAKRKSAFGPDEQQIAQTVARQLASALNNSYLYSVIREQADRLGLMLRSQQIETSQSNAILESIADGVLVTDADLKVMLYNAAAERILNLASSQVLGKEIFDFIGIFGSETVEWGETIRQWRSTPPEDHRRASRPERLLLEDGRVISVLPAPVVIGGDFLGTVSIFRDITREVEVDRLKSEFVATVSHELRTPMTSIKGFVDLMLMGAAGDLSEQQQHFLQIVRTNTNRLEILVNDLLDISRIETGKATLIFQELDVRQLLDEMQEYIQHRTQEESKAMQFSHDAPKELPPIWGDLERVRQILANIVENSFNYTPEGGAIEMRARQVDDHIEIEVSDNGMGISLEEQERIFERFYRGEQALIMGVSGTGLGLAIVLNLVEMHKGRIWVTSDGPGKGTTFTVSLPIAKGKVKEIH